MAPTPLSIVSPSIPGKPYQISYRPRIFESINGGNPGIMGLEIREPIVKKCSSLKN
jgi:hypothetical protein